MKLLSTLILFLFLSSGFSFPQYSNKDLSLVRTTYTKEFNKEIIDSYLFSGNSQKVNAALLSIAQSEDTLWISDIKKIDFIKHGKYICFALGELGSCRQSEEYLLSLMKRNDNPKEFIPYEYEALGKTGSLHSYKFLISSYFNSREKSNGISLALYNYFIRNIGWKDSSLHILNNEIEKSPFPGERNFYATFALYRIGPDKNSNGLMVEELIDYFKNEANKESGNKYLRMTIPYILGCLRRNKYFPDNEKLLSSLLNSKDFGVKVEAAQTLCYFPFKNEDDLKLYLGLLKNNNANIARAAASSIKNLKLVPPLSAFLKQYLQNEIAKNKYSSNTAGELFLSYIKLFPVDFSKAAGDYEALIPKEYFYQACGELTSSAKALDYLFNKFNNENEINKNIILQSILNFQSLFPNNENIRRTILNSINSTSPALISIAADGLDSAYVSLLKTKLTGIISSQIKKYKSDPNFLESVMSLVGLSQKMDKKFSEELLNNLKDSGSYSIKKFALAQLGLPALRIKKDEDHFPDFWKYAFKYKYAVVETSKGKFKIEFLPQYAPVSVGNFCSLAGQKFFKNNIFHRVVPGFVTQGGDPQETGWGGPGYDIVSEFSPVNYFAGMVGMASAGKDTEGSQWFVTQGAFPHLNGRYTIFAKTVSGLSTVDRIDQGDRILGINFVP